ncbi:MAG: endonuclease III [Candidatus Binatia bacterium]
MNRETVPRRESREARAKRAQRIVGRLAETYPDADCELDYGSPFQLLIATILSAQCTDVMVNQVTPALFEEYPDASSLARAPQRKVEKMIRRTGFFSQKTTAIREAAKTIVRDHGGEVPKEMDSLTALKGVGRKTASVVLGTAFGIPAVFVDTHVMRLTNRLGLTRQSTPEKIEQDIRALLPPDQWVGFCHRLIHHGRRICHARRPKCEVCPLADLCPQIGI